MPEGVVTRTVLIPAGADDVWDALVDPSRLEDWFADEVEAGELVPEAEIVFRWEDGSERVGVIEEVDAPRRLTFRWAEVGGEESEVAFELDEEPAGTRVTVVERGLRPASAGGGTVGSAEVGPRSEGSAGWGPRMSALGLAACAVLA